MSAPLGETPQRLSPKIAVVDFGVSKQTSASPSLPQSTQIENASKEHHPVTCAPIGSAKMVSLAPKIERPERIDNYDKVSKHLGSLTDSQLSDLLESATPLGSGIGGDVMKTEVEGVSVIIKKIALTDTELQNPGSTRNIFGLPLKYQYRVGSAGFGVWREEAAHKITTDWVLRGECENFPLMYHSRDMPRTTKREPTEEIEGIVEYWDSDTNIEGRLRAKDASVRDVVIFMEDSQKTLRDYLHVEMGKDTITPEKIAKLECELNKVAAFMKSKGFLHMDSHALNVMVKDEQLYFIDFGLALSQEFELSPEEIAFLEKHGDYDHYLVLYDLTTKLLEGAIIKAHGKEGVHEKIKAYFLGKDNTISDLPRHIVAFAERNKSICALMGTFYRDLQSDLTKNTPFPADELAREWAKIHPHSLE